MEQKRNLEKPDLLTVISFIIAVSALTVAIIKA